MAKREKTGGIKRGRKAIVFLLIAAAFIFMSTYAYKKAVSYKHKQDDLKMLSSEIYDAAFISNYDISTYAVENYGTLWDYDIVRANYCFYDIGDLNDYLSAVFSAGNELKRIYIGIDPYSLWRASKGDIEYIQKEFENNLIALADSHPETSFEIILSYPSMQYWLSLSEKERETSYVLYQRFVEILTVRENIPAYYMGGHEWLIQNPGNYVGDFTTVPEISDEIFTLRYMAKYLIDSENADSMVQRTAYFVEKNLKAEPQYPDLSDWDIVFLGDSIVANNGVLSMANLINSYTGASVFNCAQGGIAAYEREPGGICFPDMAEKFTNGQTEGVGDNFKQGVTQYLAAEHSEKKLCFIINYGLNDYFEGCIMENKEDPYDITTYAGAMRTGIAALREKYPDALYIIMGPGNVEDFEHGMEPHGEEQLKLPDYYDKAVSLSEELDTAYIDLYHEFPNEEYELGEVLADGIHYNEVGRYAVGVKIIDFLEEYQS